MNGIDKLIQLVPPPELCKQIPEGAFADSALVWYRATISGDYVVLPRLYKNVDAARTVAPAPTLEEILEALPTIQYSSEGTPFYLVVCDYRNNYSGWGIGYGRLQDGTFKGLGGAAKGDKNPATAALRLWMEVNNGR